MSVASTRSRRRKKGKTRTRDMASYSGVIERSIALADDQEEPASEILPVVEPEPEVAEPGRVETKKVSAAPVEQTSEVADPPAEFDAAASDEGVPSPSGEDVEASGGVAVGDMPSAAPPISRVSTPTGARLRSRAPVTPDLPSPGQSVEALRVIAGRLSAKIRRRSNNAPFSLAITSPEPGSGKSFASVNLAMTLCETSGKSVLLVEGDLRRPTFDRYFEVDPGGATVSALCQRESLDDGWRGQPVRGTMLEILPAGASEMGDTLSSDRLEWLVETALQKYGLVIFDCPPLPVASALRISDYCDGTLLIVRRDYTKQVDLATALGELSPERVMGIVLGHESARRISIGAYY